MNLKVLILLFLISIIGKCFGEIKLIRNGNDCYIDIEGNKMKILGGELGNSSATCESDMRVIFPRLKEMQLNTVLVPAYWDLIEPREGEFDFALSENAIDIARENDLKIVFLWFGSWKNSMSCYAPEWVKKDQKRFPRARTSTGKPLEIITPFSEEMRKADEKAFVKWLSHITQYDKDNAVIMIQIENEIGMLEEARDYSVEAEAQFKKNVPIEIISYMKSNKDRLHPSLLKKWEENDCREEGNWKEIFGDDLDTDEYFMAWNYAKYVETLAKKGRQITSMPFYVNAALNSRGRLPGEYPSAGPLAHLKDFWHAGAPTVDFLSPDIYDTGFENWVSKYALEDNLLFIPETKRGEENGPQAYYVIGHHNGLGISPFSIENSNTEEMKSISSAYSVIKELMPLITNKEKYQWMDGALLSQENPETIIFKDDRRLKISHFLTLPWDQRSKDGSPWPAAGGIILKTAPDEYVIAGKGIVIKFEDEAQEADISENLGEDGFLDSDKSRVVRKSYGNYRHTGLVSIEEVKVNPDGSMKRIRSYNGDETHQGRHVRISIDDDKILRVTTYAYE